MADGGMARESLEDLMTRLRPRLHRYCARMVGSAFDGEDVVQDAFLKASEAYATSARIERPEPWLFRIAHNTALDAIRRRKRRHAVQSDVDLSELADPSAVADARVGCGECLAAFARLSPSERSSVVLVDVLGDSLAETADVLGVSLAAVKAALHRGRARLKTMATAADAAPPVVNQAERQRLRDYADRFNARDFDALRDLLAQEVRLDLVGRLRLSGRKDVSVYFTRYDAVADWRFAPALAGGRPALLGSDPDNGSIRWVVLIDWSDGRITAIRDFKYASYVMDSLSCALL